MFVWSKRNHQTKDLCIENIPENAVIMYFTLVFWGKKA